MAVLVGLAVLPSLLEEPLRRHLERAVNARLRGYSMRLRAVDLQPLRFAITLEDAVLVQDAHPDPPVADLELLDASVHWRALLSGAIVSDVIVTRPRVWFDRRQLVKEAVDETPLVHRGWQDALLAVYPLTVNRLEVRRGEVYYTDVALAEPLAATGIAFVADNIRNVRSERGTYPSRMRLRARIHDSARVRADGRADFLAAPLPAVHTAFAVDDFQLRYLAPLLEACNAAARGGEVSVDGKVEWTAAERDVALRDVTVRGLDVDVVRNGTPIADFCRPDIDVHVGTLVMTNGTLGFVDATASPAYRLYVADATLRARNLGAPPGTGPPARAALDGKFMASGDLAVHVGIRSPNPPAFTATVELADTDLTTLNDALRAEADLDVTRGRLSIYSEVRVERGQVHGYVKPLVVDLDVYDREQDRDKSLLHQAYEGIIGGLATVFENRAREQVATVTDVSGPLDAPNANLLQAALHVFENAFVRAILPGLERHSRRG